MKKILFPILALVLALSLALPMAAPVVAAVDSVQKGSEQTQPVGRVIYVPNFADAIPPQIITPTGGDSFAPEQYTDNDHFQVFDEQQGVVLGSDLTPDWGSTIPSGTTVNSHFIHFDQVGTTTWFRACGEITFDGDIIGLIVLSDSLDATDALLGLAVTYPAASVNYRGLESTSYQDLYWVSGDTLTVDLQALNWLDQIRVITEAEPFTTVLCAGQHIPVGNVIVDNDGTNLSVTYEITEPGWLLVETHLEVVENTGDFPTTKKGNPIPGHFSWSETHDPPVDTYTYTIPLADIGGGVAAGDPVYIAAHAEVVFLDETCIDFEAYSEFDTVDTVSTPNGDVNFYMTSYTPLATLEVGDYAALTPSGDLPVVASPGTNDNPPATYSEIVAFTTGGPLYTGADDIVLDDNGTGAGGNTLTDPQDTSQDELMWHAYSQFLGIVIDVTGLDWVEDLGFATIDFDHGELWHYLYFNADGMLIHKYTKGPATDNSGDGVAYWQNYMDEEYSIAKVVVFGEMNTNVAGIVGYAIDNICITSVVQEETAWGGACDSENYWSDPDNLEGFVYFFNPDGKGNWASYFVYEVQ